MKIELQPIGWVRGGRAEVRDDDWGDVRATVEIDPEVVGADALKGLQDFSHVEVIFFFDRVPEAKLERNARRPRNNPAWPEVGILAQRGKNRPNRLGATVCRVVGVDGLHLAVEGLDAVDGTPILDIKPYMQGYAPRGSVREPDWAREIMEAYW